MIKFMEYKFTTFLPPGSQVPMDCSQNCASRNRMLNNDLSIWNKSWATIVTHQQYKC